MHCFWRYFWRIAKCFNIYEVLRWFQISLINWSPFKWPILLIYKVFLQWNWNIMSNKSFFRMSDFQFLNLQKEKIYFIVKCSVRVTLIDLSLKYWVEPNNYYNCFELADPFKMNFWKLATANSKECPIEDVPTLFLIYYYTVNNSFDTALILLRVFIRNLKFDLDIVYNIVSRITLK